MANLLPLLKERAPPIMPVSDLLFIDEFMQQKSPAFIVRRKEAIIIVSEDEFNKFCIWFHEVKNSD